MQLIRSNVCRCSALLVVVWVVFGNNAPQRHVFAQAPAITCPVDMRILVVSANGKETVLPAIRQALDYLGTPYDVYTATAQPGGLTSSKLSGPCHAFYQAVMLTSGELGYTNTAGQWVGSALTDAEWLALRGYEAAFNIRQATWYTFPSPQFGYNAGAVVNPGTTPVTARFTPAGAAVFSYMNAGAPLTIQNAWMYLTTTPVAPEVTPLLMSDTGHTLAAVHKTLDGRETLSLTFDGNQHLTHTIALGYGLINWATRGVFLGERHVYMSPQVDDLFIHNDQWLASTTCGTAFEATGAQHRTTASDLQAVLDWQARIQSQPTTQQARLSIAFNGYGATRDAYVPDDLTPFVRRAKVKSQFHWISHTFTHENLDSITAAGARYELNNNNRIANQLQLPGFSEINLVTPDVSGLINPAFLRVAWNQGVRYVVSDTSRVGYNNPSPNTGIPNQHQPGILMIPRYPNNLFFNVGAPNDWTAEYNCMYRGYWLRDLSYNEILEIESRTLLTYLLKGDANPWMFHQTNLDAYDGTRTLLTDLLDVTLGKYNALYNLPIASPEMDRIGVVMKDRATYNASGVKATLNPNGSITVRVSQNATVPITGLKTLGAELYGGQYITKLKVTRKTPVTIAGI